MKNFNLIFLFLLISLKEIFSQVFPTDNRFWEQWYLYHQGVPQNQRADIRAPEAWSITKGNSSIKIAIIESNTSSNTDGGEPNATHPDLLGRITTHNTSSISEHATGVAGLIVANPNNGGIVGINWYSPLNSYSFTDISDNLDDRIIQAKNDGNKVISLSHGSDEFLEEPYGALFSIYNSNITFIKSMGNNLGSGISHPANHPGIIAVGSSTKSNTRSNFSNYGNHIKFLAPGGEGYGYPNNLNILTTSSTDYFYNSGTSYSAPLVAGSVGLLLALRNDLSNDDIENLLILSCDKLPEMGANNWTDRHGYGRINVKKALDFLQTPFQLIHFSSTGGIVYSTSDLYQLTIFSGESGLGTGVYWVKRYELRKTINFPTSYDHFVWGRGSETNGWSLAQPNHGMKFCEILNYNSNSVTLRTYVYEIWNTSSYFGFYPASPQNVTFSFTVLGKPLVAPVIANITQNPVPIYKGTGGYVYANLSQGNGTINYNWFSTNQPSYVSINPNGSSCQITYLNVVESIPGDAPTWDFGCTVTNPAFPGWSSTMRFSPSLNSDPNGCPTLAFDNRGTLISENPLLITSMSNPGKDVTDYYLINTPLAPVNNKINVTIHEPQTEHTWFDNFSLLETRANPDETIVVNDEGQVINYKGVLPARILLNGETDITSNLLELDSLSVELNPGDKLTISRNAVEGDGDVVLGGEEPIIVKDRPSLIMNILTESKVEDSEEIKTESIPITNFFLRPNKSIISKRLRNLPTGTIEITVNKRLTLDYFVFVSDLRTARTRELPLVSAVHNVNGDVKTKLTGIDQNYSEMYPTERIDLSFSTTINSGNRAYILKTVGRYETDTTFLAKQNNLAKLNEQPIIPTENKLYDNYPNPFNPSTIIKYSLKDGGRVSLKIFNSLGEEVRTLVNETEAAGIYEVEFNASNLPSGVYIYQLTTPGFTQARKMILAK